jgi:hypothetical protein
MHLLRTISGVDAVLGISRLASFALLAMHDKTKRFVRVLDVGCFGRCVRGDPQSTEGLRKWGHVDSQKLFEKLIKTVANFQDFFPLDCFMLVWPVFFLILENKKTYLGGSFRR